MLLLIELGRKHPECQSSPGHDGVWWSYHRRRAECWYQGDRAAQDLLQWAKQSRAVVIRPDPGARTLHRGSAA